MKKNFGFKSILFLGMFLMLSVGISSVGYAFSWGFSSAKPAANNSPKIWDNVQQINQILWGSPNFNCNDSASGFTSACALTYEELLNAKEKIYSFTGDFGPEDGIILNNHNPQPGDPSNDLIAPYPTNSWFAQSFWSRYRLFGQNTIEEGDSKGHQVIINGNKNCVGAGWNSCLATLGDGYSFSYNQAAIVFPQPLGIKFMHPMVANDPQSTAIGIFGDQKSYGMVGDSTVAQNNPTECPNSVDGLCGYTNVQQSKFNDMVIRPAGNMMAEPILKLVDATVTCTPDTSQKSIIIYSKCKATWENVSPGNYAIGITAQVKFQNDNHTYIAHQYNVSVDVGTNAKLSNNAPNNAVNVKTKDPVPPNCVQTPYNPGGSSYICVQNIVLPQPPVGSTFTLTWDVMSPNPDSNAPTLVATTAQSSRYYTLSPTDLNGTDNSANPTHLPTQIIPDAKSGRMGAWSTHFLMPYEIEGKSRSLDFTAVKGMPMVQFTANNGAVPAFTITGTPTPGDSTCSSSNNDPMVQWISGGPQPKGDNYPTLTGQYGELANQGTIAVVKVLIGKQCKVVKEQVPINPSDPNSGYKEEITNYLTYKTTNYYAIFAPKSSYWVHSEYSTRNADFALHLGSGNDNNDPASPCTSVNGQDPGQNCHFVVALLPPDTTDANATDRASTLQQYAFNYINTTSVNYNVAKNGQVETNYQATFMNNGNPVEDLSGIINQPSSTAALGLMPNQYFRFSDETAGDYNYVTDKSGQKLTYDSVLGQIRLISGANFKTTFQFHGVLPYMPGLPSDSKNPNYDPNGINQQVQYMDTYHWLYGFPRFLMTGPEQASKYAGGMKIILAYPGDNSATCTLVVEKQANPALYPQHPQATCTDKNTLDWQPNASYFTYQDTNNQQWFTSLDFSLMVKYKGKWVTDPAILKQIELPNSPDNKYLQTSADHNPFGSPDNWLFQGRSQRLDLSDPAYSNYRGKVTENIVDGHDMGNKSGGWDTYFGGKRLNQMVQAAQIAQQLNQPDLAKDIYTAAENMLDVYFDNSTEYNFQAIPLFDYNAKYKAPVRQYGGYYFAWDHYYESLLGFPTGFGAASTLNDHIFHYGYFVNTAAQLSMLDPAWQSKYQAIINDIVYDFAPHIYTNGNPGIDDQFQLLGGRYGTDRGGATGYYYDMASWDPYIGHAWASGADTSMDGPNIESSSEQINAYAGMILWGEVTGNKAMTKEGIYLYTTAIHSAYATWFGHSDNFGKNSSNVENASDNYLNDNFGKFYNDKQATFTGFAVANAEGSLRSSTFFGVNGFAQLAINIVPITGGSLYLGHYPDQVSLNYQAAKYLLDNWNLNGYTKKFEVNGNDMPYQVLLAEYAALSGEQVTNPDGTLNISYWNPGQDDKNPTYFCAPWEGPANADLQGTNNGNMCMDDGETRIHAYTFIRAINDYGVPKFVSAPTYSGGDIDPLYSVFDKGGVLTHVVYNPTDSTQTITFPDGTTCSNVAAKSLQVCGSAPIVPVINWDNANLKAKATGARTAEATWNAATLVPNPNNDLLMYEVVVGGVTKCKLEDITSCNIKGLQPSTLYTASVTVSDPNNDNIAAITKQSPPFTTAPGITWPGKDSGSAAVDNHGHGSGSFTADATDSSGKTVSYELRLSGQGKVTYDPLNPGRFTLNGAVDTDETVIIAAVASDADPVQGTAIKIQKVNGSIVWPGQNRGSAKVDVKGNGSGEFTADAYDKSDNEVTYTARLSGKIGSVTIVSPGHFILTSVDPSETVIITANADDAPSKDGTPIKIQAEIPVINWPGEINATPGQTDVQVAWQAASINVPGDEISYKVTIDGTNLSCETKTLSCNIQGLKEGEDYTAKATATDKLNKAPPVDKAFKFTTQPLVPKIDWPGEISATPGQTDVQVAWQAGSINVPGDELSYKVTIDGTDLSCETKTLNCNIPGLTAGTDYTAKATATDKLNKAPPVTKPFKFATQPIVPKIDWPGEISTTPGQTNVQVAWQAGSINVPKDELSYKVTIDGTDLSCETKTLSCNIQGLKAGTDYTATATATDSLNKAPPVDKAFKFTTQPATVPVINWPGDISANPGQSNVALSWQAASLNPPVDGDAINYTVVINGTNLSCQTTTLSCNIPGLQAGQTYQATATAEDTQKLASSNKNFSFTTQPLPPPLIAPTVSSAQRKGGSPNEVNVNFTVPAYEANSRYQLTYYFNGKAYPAIPKVAYASALMYGVPIPRGYITVQITDTQTNQSVMSAPWPYPV